jgi:hypothetical protein
MRKLKVDAPMLPIASGTLLALQIHAANKPFLPRLKRLECTCVGHDFLPFIPLFLPPQLTEIDIKFYAGTAAIAVASVINTFPTLCPNLERVTLRGLERYPVVTDAVSEMLLSCNRDSLRVLEVGSPLAEEAQEVVYRLPKLSRLRTVIEGHTLLPQMVLPNLTEIDVKYGGHLDWLQGFHGATLGKLECVTFRPKSKQIGDFLGAFAKVALTTSAQNTLSAFRFYTFLSWTPDYYSLLPFKQLKELDIQFDCHDGCSSRVDDDVITALAQAMPKLEILQLGRAPCGTPTGATVHGFIVLSSRCLNLRKLQIHFQGQTLVDAATTFPATDEPVASQEGCALTDLEVGHSRISSGSAARVARVLLQIFPHLRNVFCGRDPEWGGVRDDILDFRRTASLVRHADSATSVNRQVGGGD